MLTNAGVIYYVPDLDVKVRVWINSTDTGKPMACVETDLSNGKTVHQTGVAWSLALIVILGLIHSAIVSGLGHSNAATHLASNAISLFGYFQSQAYIGMTAVKMPPIVRAWTQNFQWSMGIIRVGFLQSMATWYQRATGGTPSTILFASATRSVQIQKRSLLERASNIANDMPRTHVPTVKGIERVGFVAKMESTNIFFTSYLFLVIAIIFTTIGFILFKQFLTRAPKVRERFQGFRSGWGIMLQGTIFRVVRSLPSGHHQLIFTDKFTRF
jgi:hypothetical protein